MNKRIKQLAMQCYKTGPIGRDGWPEYTTFDEQKFAELIIQDCMDVVDGYTKGRTFDTHYDAVEQIEALFGIKHTGVEE